MDTLIFVGIDVSKATLDVAVRPTGETWTSANAPDGIDALVARIAALAPTLAVLEATGRYEAPCAAALASAGVPVAVVNPRQVRDFARATGRLAPAPPRRAGDRRARRGRARALRRPRPPRAPTAAGRRI